VEVCVRVSVLVDVDVCVDDDVLVAVVELLVVIVVVRVVVIVVENSSHTPLRQRPPTQLLLLTTCWLVILHNPYQQVPLRSQQSFKMGWVQLGPSGGVWQRSGRMYSVDSASEMRVHVLNQIHVPLLNIS